MNNMSTGITKDFILKQENNFEEIVCKIYEIRNPYACNYCMGYFRAMRDSLDVGMCVDTHMYEYLKSKLKEKLEEKLQDERKMIELKRIEEDNYRNNLEEIELYMKLKAKYER